MHVAFVNPQGNFDPEDSYWTAHPDFGGQLVYVKQDEVILFVARGNQAVVAVHHPVNGETGFL